MDTTGYKVDEENLAENIGESQYILISAENSNGGGVYLDIVNTEDKEMNAKDCIVGAVSTDLYEVYGYGEQENELIKVSLPGGIQIKKSTYDDVISKYGEPTETREGTYVDHTYLTWELDSNSFYDYVEIVIDNTTNTVYEFDYTKYY